MLDYSKLGSINEARYLHFKSKCKPKEAAKLLDCIRNVDLYLFSPCKQVLMEQIKRSWYIVKFYRNAALADPVYNLLDDEFELTDRYVI